MAQQNWTWWQPITWGALPNNPINKLNGINQWVTNINNTPMNNANINTSAPMSIRPDLINSTQTPVQQNTLQPITNTTWDTNTNSRFVWFQNPTNNNLNKWENPIMWQSTSKRDNTVKTNTKQKEKWNVPTLRDQVNTHNNNVTQTLRDFQKAVHDTNWGLTAEMIQQAFPEYNVDDALNLQQELIPIVVWKWTYANIDEIEKYYPSLIKRYNFEELNNEYQQTSKSNKRAIEAVNNLSESDYNKLSPDGKKYYEIVLKMEAAVEWIKDNYDVPKETSDAEILNRAINFDPELKSEVAQLQTLNLTWLDKAYLKLDTNWINNIAKLTNDAVNWVNDKYQQNISQPLEELATTQAPHLAWVSWLANAIWIIPQTLAEVSNAFMHVNKPYESPSWDSDISEIAPQVFSDIVEVSFPLIFEFIAAKYPSATMLFESPLWQPTSTVEWHNFWKTIWDWFERAKNNITWPILEATVMNTPYWDNMTEEAQEYIKNAIPLLFAHFISKWGEKVLKSDTFQAWLKVTWDLIWRAAKEWRDSAKFQKYVEDWLNRIEWGEVYDEKWNKIWRAVEQWDLSREQRWRIIKEWYKWAKDSVQDSMKNIGKDYETAKNEVRTFKDLQEQLNKTRGEIDDLKDEIIDDQLEWTKEKSTWVIKEKDTELKEVDEELKNIDKDKTLIEKWTNEIAWISDDIKDNPFFSSDSTKMIDAVKEDWGLDIAEYQTRQYEQILDFIADRINDAINTKNKEVWPLYDVAVQQNVPVILDNIVKWALDIIRNNDGISYNNWVLEFLDDRFSWKEQKALQGIVDRLLNPDTDWNTSTLWDVRKYADLNAKWGTSATTDWVAIIRDLRKVIDDWLRDQVPWFKDIDTEYVNAIDTLDELSWKLTLKKAKPWTLRENAVSTVKNLLNPSNRLYLNRLEKLIPWITQKLQSIKNLRQVYNAYVKGNTSWFTAWIENAIWNKVTSTVWGLIWASWGIPWAMLWYLIGRGLEKSIKWIKKAAVEKVAKTITPKARLELKKIAARIEEWKKLTADQKKRLEEIKNKIIVEWDKVKKTREQERAWKEEKARIERERNNFIDKVEEWTLDNALPYNKNAWDGGKTIITWNDKTIVTDNKWKSQKKSWVTETNSEWELKWEKTKQQRLKEGIIKARTDKAEDSLKRLKASLNVLKDKKDLTETQIDLLRKDAERLRDDINKLEIRWGVEAPQEMVDTLNKAYDLLRENWYETTVEPWKTAITWEWKTAITWTATAEKPTTSWKTAVLDKTETPQKTAQNIIQDAQNVEKWKQLPTNPETKNWKPVVIDSKWNAKDFYHGTPNGWFTEFDIEKRGTSNDFSSFGDYGRGIYFTPYKEDAENYATKNTKVEGKTPTVYKVKLYMSNPLRLDILANIQKDSYNIEWNPVQNANWNNEFKKILDKYWYTEEQYEKDYSMWDGLYDNWWDWDIRAQWYDWVVSPDGREWIVTDVNQIQTLEYESKKPSKTAITWGKVTQNKEEVKNVENVKKNKLTPIEAFREETAKYEPDYDSIEADAKALAEDILTNAWIDAEVVDLVLTWSKARGYNTEDSDTDILIEIRSKSGKKIKEDSLFNILNDKELNDSFDFNPIVEEDSWDTLETKVVEQWKYMEWIKRVKRVLDKEWVKRDKKAKEAAESIEEWSYYKERQSNSKMLEELSDKTTDPFVFSNEEWGKTAMARAPWFAIWSDWGWNKAMKYLLDKINEVRKSKLPSKTQITETPKTEITNEEQPKEVSKTEITDKPEDKLVKAINDKVRGRHEFEDWDFKLLSVIQPNNTSIAMWYKDGGVVAQAFISKDEKWEKVDWHLNTDVSQTALDKFNRILNNVWLRYMVWYKDGKPSVMNKKTWNVKELDNSYSSIHTWSTRLKDTNITVEPTNEDKLERETRKATRDTKEELYRLKQDVKKNKAREEEKRLKEKRAELTQYIEETYPKWIAQSNALKQLTQVIDDMKHGFKLSNTKFEWDKLVNILPDNYRELEYWEALKMLSEQPWVETNASWERDYYDSKKEERVSVYNYFVTIWKQRSNERIVNWIQHVDVHTDYNQLLTKYWYDYLNWLLTLKALKSDAEEEERDMRENPDKYVTEEEAASLFKPWGTITTPRAEQVVPNIPTINNVEDFKREIISKDNTDFNIRLFYRMKSDIDYISNNNLWEAWYRHLRAANKPEKQIEYMNALLEAIPENERPDIDMKEYASKLWINEDKKSEWNAFWLKKQKWSSRINNFTNVIMKIVDKYEDQIEDNILRIEKEPYLPLIITYFPSEKTLTVRHINHWYNDPAMRFTITDEWKLHVTWVKQAFMEQLWYTNWSTDINDKDELLHVQAVNLEDQFLWESTIDEDTWEMKDNTETSKVKTTEITWGDNKITTKVIEKEAPKTAITDNNKWVTTIDELVSKNWVLSYDNYNKQYTYRYPWLSYYTPQWAPIMEWETIKTLSPLVWFRVLEQQLDKAFNKWFRISTDIWVTISQMNFDSVEYEDDWNETRLKFYRLGKNEDDEPEYSGKVQLEQFLNERWDYIQDLLTKDIDNSQNNVITSSSNTPLTSNNIKDGGNKENSRGNNEGHKELSDTKQNVQQNDKITKAATDKGDLSRITQTQNNSWDNSSEHGTWSTNGRSKSAIREKWDNIITDKTVTQARDINRESVSILEKHDYSTNPNDYTKEEIDTLRQYEWRGGVNDKEDSKTQWALNQYYTKDNIIKAMWRLVDKYRPKEWNLKIIEPSMWVWRFFLYAPEWSDLYWFEYDKVPWTIAKILFPNANITIGDFQDNFMVGKFSMWDNYTGKKYDVVIWNPPYEERQWRQRGLWEEPKITRFDDYFIKRGIDMLEDWWILLFVTSSQFLRGADNYAKQKISENAELIDAYRIPIWAFDRTQVETDIVVFKKTKDGWDKNLLSASEWFIQNPDKILWEERNDIQWRFWPKTWVVWDLSAIDEIAAVKVWTDGLPAKIEKTFTPTKETTNEQKTEKNTPKKKVRAKKTVDPTQWQDWTEIRVNDKWEQETIVWWKSLNWVIFKGKGWPTWTMVVWKWGIGKYQKLLNANGKIWDPDIKLESDREWLNYINWELEPNILYASWHIPSKLQQLEIDYEWGFIDDAQYNKQKDLLEKAKPEPKAFQDIYFSPYADRVLDTETDTISSEYEYWQWVVDKKQTVRKLFRKRVQEREKSFGNVIHIKKTKDWIEYETQSVWQWMLWILDKNSSKVSQEQKNAIVTKMPKAFNEFIKSNEIDEAAKVRLQDQFNKKYNSYANFEYDELWYTVEDISNTFMWKEFNTSDVQTRGIARILTTEAMIIAHWVWQWKTIEWIIWAIASMQQWKAKKAIIVIPAWTKASRMQTVASLFPNQEMIDLWSLAWTSWIRKRLAETYWPDPRDWIQDGQLVFLEHSAVWNQISFKPDTLSLLEQRLTDAMESSFDTEKDIAEKKKRLASLEEKQDSWKLSAAQIEKNNKQIENLLWEIEKLGRTTADLPSILKKYVWKWLDEAWVNKAIELIDNDYDYYKSEMEKYIDSSDRIEDKAKAKEIADSIFINERAIYLEDLWVDHITVDEAHNFRNLFKKALQEDDEWNASFHAWLNAWEWSKAAKNLYAMTQYIMSINGGWNVILLTATPFINNPSEVYNMLSYVWKNGMAEMWVTSMDDFYDNYVWLENKLTPTASASWVWYKNVMVQFNNTDTLIKNLLDRYIDYEWESSAIVKPRLNTVVARLKMWEEQQYIENLLEEQIDTNKYIDTYKWKDLWIERKTNDKWEEQWAVIEWMTQANLNLISPYLTKYKKSELPTLTVDEMLRTSPKLQAVVEIAKRQRSAWIMRGTFIYMPDGKVLHELLKEALEKAIPWVKVWIINGDTKYKDLTETQAKKLWLGTWKWAKARLTWKQFHDWEIDILIWGDNTKEWLNLQGNWYMTIEVSQPRNANDRIQLLWRIWRQWNLSNEVIDVLLLMENSSDIYRFELMSRKNSRWSLLEMLSSYKKWEKLEDVRPQTELDMNEEKMALFTDPEKKAKVSIAMDSARLEDDVAQLEWQIDSVTKIVENISNWWGYYGTYKEMPEAWYKSYLNDRRDSEWKPIMTSIFDEKALEPLEEQLQYHYDQAYRDLSMENERYERWRSKADIDKKIKKNNPYYNSSSNYNSIRERLSLARGVRNSVLRQTEALWIKTVEWLTKYLDELNQQKEKTKETIKNIESTLLERTEEFKKIQEANKENEMSIESILEDITEEFKHQITLWSKDELKNWIELTKDLPKREQAKNKTAITEGKNRYIWQSKDYVWKQATFNKPKNLITSQFSEYTEQNPKPEIKYIWYVPKEVIKKVDGSQLTKIWYQSQFRQLASKIDEIEYRAERNAENNWRLDEQEILDKDSYYQSLKKRILNLMLKFAKNFEDEIIKAFKKDNPWKTYATAEDFYDYINDYQPLADWKVSKIKDKYIKEWAEYLASKFNWNNWNSKNAITANENNKITDY